MITRLLWFGCGVLATLAVVFGCIWYLAGAVRESLTVDRNVELHPPSPRKSAITDSRECLWEELALHRKRSGSLMVFRYERSDPGDRFVIDDEGHKTLSIEIPPALVGRTLRLPHDRVRIAYSAGGDAWPCGTCLARTARGTLTTSKLPSAHWSLSFDLVVRPRGLSGIFDPEEEELRAFLGGGDVHLRAKVISRNYIF